MSVPDSCKKVPMVKGQNPNTTIYRCIGRKPISEGLIIKADPNYESPWISKNRRDNVHNTLSNVNTRAALQINTFTDSVGNACDNFQNFTDDFFESTELDEMSADVVSKTLTSALSLFTTILPTPASFLGKLILMNLYGRLQSELSSAIKPPRQKGVLTTLELKHMVRKLATSAKKTIPKNGSSAHKNIHDVVTRIQISLRDNKRNLSKDDDYFLYDFLDVDDTEMEFVLESFYCIPSQQYSIQFQKHLYHKLVEQFAKSCAPAMDSRPTRLDGNYWKVKKRGFDFMYNS